MGLIRISKRSEPDNPPTDRAYIFLDENDMHLKQKNPDGTVFDLTQGGGASTFLDLTDTPDSYSGQAGKAVIVKSTEDGLEFGEVSAEDEKVKVSSTDTTSGYLTDKLVAGNNIQLTKLNSGGNEQLEISATGGGTATPGGDNGAVQFNDNGSFGGDANNFYWDNTNKRLGIKTSNPQRDVHVWAEGGGPAAFRLSRGDVNHSAVFEFDTNNNATSTDPRYFMGIPFNYRYFSISRYTGSVQTDFVIKEDGKIGLGTDSPTRLVSVGNPGDGSSAIANQWETYSDRRIKTSISALDKGLDVITKLKPVKFKYKNDNTKRTRFGLIAQDVIGILPEVVSSSDGIYSIDYNMIIPILINAINELSERIKVLEEKVHNTVD